MTRIYPTRGLSSGVGAWLGNENKETWIVSIWGPHSQKPAGSFSFENKAFAKYACPSRNVLSCGENVWIDFVVIIIRSN